jgi:hypothetical protein
MCRRSEIFLVLLNGSLLHSNIFIGALCNLVSHLDYERYGAMGTCRWWIIRDKHILHTCVSWSSYVIWNIIVMHDTELAFLYVDVADRCGLKLPKYKTFLVSTGDCSPCQTYVKWT